MKDVAYMEAVGCLLFATQIDISQNPLLQITVIIGLLYILQRTINFHLA